MELLDRFKENIHLYSNTEKRLILLLAIKSIVFDFNRSDFEIEYRLIPYVDIKTLIKLNKK